MILNIIIKPLNEALFFGEEMMFYLLDNGKDGKYFYHCISNILLDDFRYGDKLYEVCLEGNIKQIGFLTYEADRYDIIKEVSYDELIKTIVENSSTLKWNRYLLVFVVNDEKYKNLYRHLIINSGFVIDYLKAYPDEMSYVIENVKDVGAYWIALNYDYLSEVMKHRVENSYTALQWAIDIGDKDIMIDKITISEVALWWIDVFKEDRDKLIHILNEQDLKTLNELTC